jgi:hypothetical protein
LLGLDLDPRGRAVRISGDDIDHETATDPSSTNCSLTLASCDFFNGLTVLFLVNQRSKASTFCWSWPREDVP